MATASRYVHRYAQSDKREGNSMIKKTSTIFATLSVILLLQPSCATVRIRQEANEASIVVKELVKTTKSWDGEFLRPYPQGQPEITIRRISVPAGARLDTHSHPVINAGVLMSGQLTVVTAEGKTLDAIRLGTAIIVEHEGTRDRLRNGSRFPCARRWRDQSGSDGADRGAASAFAGPGILVPLRNAALFQWCL